MAYKRKTGGRKYKTIAREMENDVKGVVDARIIAKELNLSDNLIERLTRLVKNLANKLSTFGNADDFDDLYMAGMMTVVDASLRFDAAESKFTTWVNYHAEAAMREILKSKGNMVRVRGDISMHSDCVVTDAEGNSKVVKPQACETLRFVRREFRESELSRDDGEEDMPYHSTLACPEPSPEEELLSKKLWESVDGLPQKEAAVLRCRYDEGMTLEETAKALEYKSRERVRQIEAKAIMRLRKRLAPGQAVNRPQILQAA